MRKEGDSLDFEYRRQMAESHLAFMIRDDRVSGHVCFPPVSIRLYSAADRPKSTARNPRFQTVKTARYLPFFSGK